MDKTTFEQTLSIFLTASKFVSKLLTMPKMLKDFVHWYCHKKEIFDMQERHTITDFELPNKKNVFEQFYYRCFSVHYCDHFIIVYNFSNVHTMQKHETQNTSNQSCFTANKRSRCSNQTGRCHVRYRMYL